jgi:hypothetical protein
MGSCKRLVLWIVVFAAVGPLMGCRSTYDITLNNGNKITGVSKPELDRKSGDYKFTTGSGKVMYVKSIRVREISPHEAEDSQFSAPPAKR